MVPLIYHPKYNITAFGLEHLHPFDSIKYRRIHDWIIRQGLRRPGDFVTPRACTLKDLLRVHTKDYLRSLRDRAELARILEVGIVGHLPYRFTDWRVLGPMRLAAGGTVLACRLAREQGLALNLSGGYHHAGRAESRGFCVYADTPLALKLMHDEQPFRSVLVVDTDAHQGDGNADVIRAWPWAHVLDFFEEDLFPFPKVDEDYPVPLSPGLSGAEYLDLLATHLSIALDRFQPEFVVYNAGSDVLANDPLTSLRLTPRDLAERDLHVITEVRARGIPLAMVLSGGYGPHSWQSHAHSIEGILTRFDRAESSRSRLGNSVVSC